jgi:hypothetical protein
MEKNVKKCQKNDKQIVKEMSKKIDFLNVIKCRKNVKNVQKCLKMTSKFSNKCQKHLILKM